MWPLLETAPHWYLSLLFLSLGVTWVFLLVLPGTIPTWKDSRHGLSPYSVWDFCASLSACCNPETEASLGSFQGCWHTAWRKTPNEVAESCCAMLGWGGWCAPGVPPNERPWDGCGTCARLTQMPEWESSFLISFSSIWGTLLKLSPASSFSSGKWDDEKILLLWVI